jgi:hypothetical protein
VNWEALTALSTAFTGAIIAITALIALREVRLGADQVRATGDQLEHLRKATQFEGTLEIFKELDGPVQTEARRYVQFDLADKLKDPTYLAEVPLINGASEIVHQELMVLRCFERIAYYEQKGLIDRDTVLMVASGRIFVMWNALERVVAIHRASIGPGAWANFEALYHLTHVWMADHGVDVRVTEQHLRERLGLDATSSGPAT